MPVELRNGQRRNSIDLDRLKRVAQALLEAIHRQEKTWSVLLTDDRQMVKIHERWMGDATPTDVLSFSSRGQTLNPLPSPPSFVLLRKRNKTWGASRPPELLGDVVISVEMVARRDRQRVFGGVTRCLIHGLLHLIGHDHFRPSDRQRMDREARHLLQAASRFTGAGRDKHVPGTL